MANGGSFPGGLAQGLRGGFRIAQAAGQNVLQAEQLELQRKRIDQQLKASTGKNLNTILNDQRSAITQMLKTIREQAEKGGDVTGLADNVRKLIEQHNRIAASASRQLGIPVAPEISADIIDATIASAPRPKTATETALEEVAGAQAQLEAIGSAPPEIQEALKRNLGFATDETTDSFFRALNEHDELAQKIAAGTATAAELTRFGLVQQRVKSLSQAAGQQFSIKTVNPDGTVTTVTMGPGTEAPSQAGAEAAAAGTFPSLPAAAQQSESERLASINTNVQFIDELLTELKENPEDFGATASLRGSVQSGIAILNDAARGIASVTGGAVDLNQLAQNLGDAFGVESIFDPNLPRLEQIENRLATALGILRLQTAGASRRSDVATFKQAKEDVRLQGLTSSQDIRARLDAIRNEFEQERVNISRGLTGTAGETTTPPRAEPSRSLLDLSPEQLRTLSREELEALIR